MDNKLIIAAAGAGKTTLLISEALNIKNSSVLITSYTEANIDEIKNKFIKENGYIPSNVTIKTWFSLLIQHGIKPFQGCLFEERVKGMILTSSKSAIRYTNRKGIPIYWGEDNFYKHYFNGNMKIYSDKLSKLVCKLDSKSNERVIDRLTNIFPTIFIDECQDLAGYDLHLISLLSMKALKLTLVCDPRQVTYLTHNERKYAQYKNGQIKRFVQEECKKSDFVINENSLSYSYRCNQLICDFSNQLYPNFYKCNSRVTEETGHDGVFLVDIKDRDKYLELYKPVQLRWNLKDDRVNSNFIFYNFGNSKGLTFNRILIYPTIDMIKWLKNRQNDLKNETRAKFYVGITRARYSVGIICDISENYEMSGISKFE